MTENEFNAIKATFPWREMRKMTPMGMQYAMIDKDGKEVPIPHMTAVLTLITHQAQVDERKAA